jgi:hypothetical protein
MIPDFMKTRSHEKFIISALKELTVPGQRWAMMDQYVGDDPNQPKTFVGFDLQFNPENDMPAIPLETVIAKAMEYKAAWEAVEYQRLRVAEYPSLTEQLDMQYWDNINGTTVWADTINAIKVKYPKP